MAHFAEVKDGFVQRVIVIDNSCAPDEATGQAFIASIPFEGEWIQTSYNGNNVEGQDRGPFAGVGYTWNGSKFAPPTIEETP